MAENAQEFLDLLARHRAEKLGAAVKGQPKAFWVAISAKLQASPDGTVTLDDVIQTRREVDPNE